MFLSLFTSSLVAQENTIGVSELEVITVENVRDIQQVFSTTIEQLNEGQFSGLAWSSDSSILGVGLGYGIELYDVSSFTNEPRFLATENWVSDIPCIPNTSRFVLGGDVHEIATLQHIETLPSSTIAFSSDGKRVVYFDYDDQNVYFHDLETGQTIGQFKVDIDKPWLMAREV